MSNKINILSVIKDHFATLRNEATDKISLLDILTFVGVPIGCGLIAAVYCFRMSHDMVSIIITAMAIFAGLLINVLVLIYTISNNIESLTQTRGAEDVEDEKRFLREIFSNISFSIVISIISVLCLVAVLFARDGWGIILSAIAVVFLVNFILTLMMAVKRIHILLKMRFASR